MEIVLEFEQPETTVRGFGPITEKTTRVLGERIWSQWEKYLEDFVPDPDHIEAYFRKLNPEYNVHLNTDDDNLYLMMGPDEYYVSVTLWDKDWEEDNEHLDW